MSKKTKKDGIYNNAIKNRVVIMTLILFIVIPVLFCTAYLTSTYTNNKPNPLEDKEYTKSSISYINKNLFEIEDIRLSRWNVVDYNDEPLSSANVNFYYEIGDAIDDDIKSIKIDSYVCYNWANKSFGTSTASFSSFNTNKTSSTINFNATFEKKPFFFVSLDLNDDVRFITSFTCYYSVNGETVSTIYVVESSYKDLYASGVTGLQ